MKIDSKMEEYLTLHNMHTAELAVSSLRFELTLLQKKFELVALVYSDEESNASKSLQNLSAELSSVGK